MKKTIILGLLGVGLCLGSYGVYDYTMGGRCSPKGKCTACKNCTGCKNCAKNGGTCSVCR
ncbi:hypothetical protein [Riemerella columbina]|uniref:hypothetical protein n=1 Tax=Riemerella columbina TaxID=103810 RepID=UPI00267001D2|nr:hypothetical protein [Riemerella columbina]WKS94749.1 hypothetical protein NYR17_07385 [Riemerella columbina]